MTKGQIARYVLLPGILPRLRHLAGSGLINIAWLLALIFASVRLLPRDHPYLNERNMGRYGMRQVLAEAGSRLVFSRRNLDQVVVYFTILAGVVALCIQFGLLIAAVLSQPVLAQTFSDMFANPSAKYSSYGPEQDIAFVILDKIFGVKGIFNSCISTGAQCVDVMGNPISKPATYPYPMHLAMHQLLGFYAVGIGIISLMIILYQITTVVGETAASGTPFGRRYNRAWAPVRLIVFFALLAPLNIGGTNAWLNGAQLITLWAAKWGSNVATNGWLYFSENLSTSYIGKAEELIAVPQAPPLAYLTRFYTVVHSCKIAYEYKSKTPQTPEGVKIDAYLIRPADMLNGAASGSSNGVPMSGYDFEKALTFSSYGNITVRFGSKDTDSEGRPQEDNHYMGKVFPICGDVTLNVGDITQPGAKALAGMYYDLLRGFFDENAASDFASMAQVIKYYAACNVDKSFVENFGGCRNGSDYNYSDFVRSSNDFVNAFFDDHIKDAIKKQIEGGKYDLPEGIKKKGWAGAAIWYNTIAEMNGAVTAALLGTPTITRYPELMRLVEAANRQQAENGQASQRFDAGGIGENEVKFSRNFEYDIARALNNAYKIFDNTNVDETPQTKKTGNMLIDAINMLFGTTGIYDIRANKDINPLAQLSSLGRAMVEQAIRNFGAAIGVSLGEGLIGLITDKKTGLDAVNNFLETVATIGILIGFILYYVLPFMPFLYFFFSVGEWAKAIFEGIIAMPLWALAHLTIDGQGLPGQNAANGYYLILEIFIRPILMFAGLIGSVMAFSTMVQVLNGVFDVVVLNVSGSDATNPVTPSSIEYYRGPVDEFFFTILYTVLCYMIGLSCFKMIDNVPLTVLRWMGVGAQSYQQLSGNRNPAENMTGTIYSSGAQTMGQIQQGLGASLGLSGQAALMLSR
jgi:conjugal transfer/type IV secretion protein DotA/TraY